MGDLPLGLGSRPHEVVGCRRLRFAREHLAEVVLGDDEGRRRIDRRRLGQPTGQFGETLVEVGTQLGDDRRVEHDRLPVATERVERALLDWRELGHWLDRTGRL